MQETRMEYPRPQLRRDDWFALNGEWEFAFDDGDSAAKYEGGRAAEIGATTAAPPTPRSSIRGTKTS